MTAVPGDDIVTGDSTLRPSTGSEEPSLQPFAPGAAFVRALDELGAGLLVFSGERIRSVSDGFCAIVDRERGELLDLDSIFALAPPPEAEVLRERLRRYLIGEDVADHFDTVVLNPRRGPRTIEVGVKAIEHEGPRPAFALIARDVTDARREATYARILATASDVLAGAHDEHAAIVAITRLAVPTLADWCAFDVESGPGALTRYAVAHVDPAGEELLWELDRRFPVRRFEGNLRARVLRSGRPLVVNDPSEMDLRAAARNREHADMLRTLGVGAAMWIPVTSFGRTHGVMSLGASKTGRRFSESDVAVAEKLGHRAAQAIERARAEERLRVRARQQAAVAELGRLGLADIPLERLLQRGVELVATTLGVELVKVLQLSPENRLRLVAGTGWRDGLVGRAEVGADAESQAGYTLVSGGPVIVEDLRTEPRFSGAELALEHGAISGLSVVIASRGDRPYGVLSTHARERRDFSVDDVSFLEAVANVLGASIDRAQGDLALRESDERLHVALAASRTGTWEWDVTSGKLTWSSEIGVLHNVPPEQFPRTFEAFLELVHPDDRAPVRAAITRSFETGDYDLEFRIVWPDGTVRWTNGQARVFFSEEGRPIRMVGTGRDITDRKVAELERDRLLELERQAALMREAFIGVMSHELRTPITTILGGSRLLADHRDTLPPETVTELFDDIAGESDRLYRLVEDLLVLTRSERGDLDRRDEPTLIGQVIARLAPEFAARAGEPIDVSGTVRLPMAEGDETYVEQILRNLVGNAIKFSPSGAHVAIVAEATDHEILVRVLDRGPGIAAEEAERVFDMFYRSPRTRTRTAGSGIGLFVVKRLVEAMSGRIWARPRDGGGAEFGFALRRHVLPEDDEVG